MSDSNDDAAERRFREYRSIRDELHFEHQQISSRMTWSIAFHTILLTAFGVLLTAFARIVSSELSATEKCYFGLLFSVIGMALPVAGVVLALLQRSAIQAAVKKTHLLRINERFFLPEGISFPGEERSPGNGVSIDQHNWESLLTGGKIPRWYTWSTDDIDGQGVIYPLWVPWVFVGLWMVVLVCSCSLLVYSLRQGSAPAQEDCLVVPMIVAI